MNLRKKSDFGPESAASGLCYLLNRPRLRSSEDYVIATGVHIDHEGSLDISIGAVEELGRLVGMVYPNELEPYYEGLTEELEQAQDARAIAEAELELALAEIALLRQQRAHQEKQQAAKDG